MECVRCHAGDHWDGAVFCHHCGTRLKNRCVEETCPGEDLDNGYRFCPLCGKESLFASLGLMDAAVTLADPDETAEPTPEPAAVGAIGETAPADDAQEEVLAAPEGPDEAEGTPEEAAVESEGADGQADAAASGEAGDSEAMAADGAADGPMGEPSGVAAQDDGSNNAVAPDVAMDSGEDGESLPAD